MLSVDYSSLGYFVTGSSGISMTVNANQGSVTAGTNSVIFSGIEQLTINGTAYTDVLQGGNGDDVLNGGFGGDDTISGGSGNDYLSASFFNFFVSSVPNNNLLTGDAGNDILTGDAGNDTLKGGNDNDTLISTSGQSLLIGGTGDDLLRLGSDDGVTDTINYTAGDGIDTVSEFVRGIDGDVISFSQIANIDVVTVGTTTRFNVGDGRLVITILALVSFWSL